MDKRNVLFSIKFKLSNYSHAHALLNNENKYTSNNNNNNFEHCATLKNWYGVKHITPRILILAGKN